MHACACACTCTWKANKLYLFRGCSWQTHKFIIYTQRKVRWTVCEKINYNECIALRLLVWLGCVGLCYAQRSKFLQFDSAETLVVSSVCTTTQYGDIENFYFCKVFRHIVLCVCQRDWRFSIRECFIYSFSVYERGLYKLLKVRAPSVE